MKQTAFCEFPINLSLLNFSQIFPLNPTPLFPYSLISRVFFAKSLLIIKLFKQPAYLKSFSRKKNTCNQRLEIYLLIFDEINEPVSSLY